MEIFGYIFGYVLEIFIITKIFLLTLALALVCHVNLALVSYIAPLVGILGIL